MTILLLIVYLPILAIVYKEKDNGRLTDILIKENSKWKYLAWSESKPGDSK